MTAPKVNTVQRGGSRLYVFEDGVKHPGVTSVVGMMAKPFLQGWAAKMAAEWAVTHLDAVKDIASRDPAAAVEVIKGAARRSTAGSADRGTEVHAYMESRLLGETPEPVSDGARAYCDAVGAFLNEWRPENVLTEFTVRNDAIGYAGSADAIINIDGENVLIDLKTGKSVYPEVALQLSAYRYAECLADGQDIPRIDACAVLHVKPGSYEFIPVKADKDAFAAFCALRVAWQFEQDKRGYLAKAVRRG